MRSPTSWFSSLAAWGLFACGASEPAPELAHPSAPTATASAIAVPTASPSTSAKPAIARWGATAVRLADQAEGTTVLSQPDAFTSSLSAFDRRARLAKTEAVDEATYLAHAGAQARGWPAASWERWQKAIRAVGKALEGLDVQMPETVLFIATTGSEEFGLPYTRGHAIVIPEKVALEHKDPFVLVAHELFHVISRHAPDRRDALYGLLGFRPVGDVKHPSEERRITNPDAHENRHAISVTGGDRMFLAVPLIRSKTEAGDEAGKNLFSVLELFLLEVDTHGAAVTDPEGTPQVHSMLATTYNQQAALNAPHAIHPEEVLADNFALLLERRSGRAVDVARPDLLNALEVTLNKSP